MTINRKLYKSFACLGLIAERKTTKVKERIGQDKFIIFTINAVLFL